MSYKDIYTFIRENITEEEWSQCNEELLNVLIMEYFMAGFDKKLFTKAKKRIVKGVLSEISNENLRECDYRVTPERWVTSMFDVDENISSKVILDSRFKKDNEKTLVFFCHFGLVGSTRFCHIPFFFLLNSYHFFFFLIFKNFY